MNKYDLVVIGAGPSGYASAMRALDFKKKTLLIEKNRVGGAGVRDGISFRGGRGKRTRGVSKIG